MSAVYLDALSVLAPGLPGWHESVPVLTGARAYREQPLPPFPPAVLPPNERRRTTRTMKLVLQVADAALRDSALAPRQVHSVFASSTGDAEIIDKICTALTLPDRPVSPTHFHNSVHNAPAGYWSIGSGCQQPSISLSAHDGSFSAGLLEATATVRVERVPVLLPVYDYPLPAPLSAVRCLTAPFAAALVLAPEARATSLARLTPALCRQAEETLLTDPGLERLRSGNPAARGLPLLAAVAAGTRETVVLPYLGDAQLRIEIEPCL